MATEFPEWSAYNYVMASPLALVDETGKSPDGKIHVYNVTYDKDGNKTVTKSHVRTDDSSTDKREYRYWDGNGNMTRKVIQEIEQSSSGPSTGDYVNGAEELGQRGDKLRTGSNGKYYSSGWGGNQYVSTERTLSKQLTKGLMKHTPVVGTILDAKEVYDGVQEDGGIRNIGKNTAKETAGVVGGAAGGAGGAWAGAAIGTAICPGIGTVIGGVVGAILGGWGGESGAEYVVDSVVD